MPLRVHRGYRVTSWATERVCPWLWAPVAHERPFVRPRGGERAIGSDPPHRRGAILGRRGAVRPSEALGDEPASLAAGAAAAPP